LTEIIKPGHSQQSLSGAREVIKRAVFPPVCTENLIRIIA
jgi:hypothetical protein